MTTVADPSIAPDVLERGAPAEDVRAFRRCLGQYATGVAIVTAAHDGLLVGMTINSFASVSLEPPLVLWSIRKASGSAQAFLNAGHFTINVLASDQVELSQQFGASNPQVFEHVAWQAGQYGAPLLPGVIGQLECTCARVDDGGDHWILVGEVKTFTRYAGEPLLFSQGQYAVAQNHPQLSAPASQPNASEPIAPSFLTLLSTANHRSSARFEEHRQQFGVTVASGRVLSRLYEQPLDRAELALTTFLGEAALDDAIRELSEQGNLTQVGTHYELTPVGRERRAALAQKAQAFTHEILAQFSAADVAAATRVLSALAAS